jgi:hypothetical protein
MKLTCRPLAKAYLVAILLFSFSAYPTLAATPTTAPSGDKISWEPVVNTHKAIRAIGKVRLPIPIIIPATVPSPLPMGLLTQVNTKAFEIDLVWHSKDEIRVRNWSSHWGRTLPLTKGAYTVSRSEHIGSSPSIGWWSYGNVGYSKSLSVSVTYFGTPKPPKDNREPFYWPSSPLRFEDRYVRLSVIYQIKI